MKIVDLMATDVATCAPHDSLNRAAQIMWERRCGSILVLDEGGLLAGVVTDRDICMAAYTQGRSLDEILVNAAMAHHVFAVSPDQNIEDAERAMAEHQIRRLPVIDAAGAAIGMLALNDLAIEAVQPDTAMSNGAIKVAHTLAAICRPRRTKRKAA